MRRDISRKGNSGQGSLVIHLLRKFRSTGIAGLALLLSMCVSSLPASAEGNAPPRVFVILCDALTCDDLRSSENANLAAFAEHGSVGMMNCAVSGPKTELSAALTLAVSEISAAEPSDGQIADDLEPVPGERDPAAVVYARRTGQPIPTAEQQTQNTSRIRHLGIASLLKRDRATSRLGAALASATPPVSAFVCGNADTDHPQRSGALLTVDASGSGSGHLVSLRSDPQSPFGIKDDPIALVQMAMESQASFVVLQLGDTLRAETLRNKLSLEAYRAARNAALHRLNILIYLLTGQLAQEQQTADILLVSPSPLVETAANPETWARLAPIVAYGPDFPPGLLTSATTRTPGLVANIDFAPTILNLFHVPAPPLMVGRIYHTVPDPHDTAKRLAYVARIDFLARLNGQAQLWIMVPLGALCFVVALTAILARRYGGLTWGRRFAPGIVFIQNMATAMLFAPIMVPPTVWEYGLRVTAWMIGLAAFCCLLARPLRVSPAIVTAGLGLLCVTIDTFTGQTLIKDSVYSSYALSGIRYYGIGNEYLGVVLGFAIAGGFAWLDELRIPVPMLPTLPVRQAATLRGPAVDAPTNPLYASEGTPSIHRTAINSAGTASPTVIAGIWPRICVALLWIAVAFLLGWPGLGANAGSLAASGAGFGVGIAILMGRRPSVRLAVACVVLGLALAFAFGAIEIALAPHTAATSATTSHVGEAMRAAGGTRGPQYLLTIIARKIAMNIHLLFTLWFVLASIAVTVAIGSAYVLIGNAMRSMFAQRPWSARGFVATLAAIGTSLLFKDSGVVTVAFLFGASYAIHVYYALITEEKPEPHV